MKLIANRATSVVLTLAAAALSLGCYTTGPYGYESPYPSPSYYGSAAVAPDYYGVGDPVPFGYGSSVYVYYGHHPHSGHYDGYCYNSGRHHHDYRPGRRHSYRIHNNVYHYTGTFGRE